EALVDEPALARVARVVLRDHRAVRWSLGTEALARAEALGVLRHLDDVVVAADPPQLVALVAIHRRVPAEPRVRGVGISGVEGAVEQVDRAPLGDSHRLPYRSRNSYLTSLPVGLRGRASTISSCSGSFWRMRPRSVRYAHSSSSDGGEAASAGTTTAHARSPVRSSGSPTTATSATFGCVKRLSSISFAEMFSMLRMMMSFTRPVMRTLPRSSSTARSPVLK